MNVAAKRRISFRSGLRIGVAALGGLQALAERNSMNADGMSYVDVARAYANGEWAGAINAHWSPFYSWLIAALMRMFNPSPQHEFASVHALNFLLFLCALAAFEFFLRELFVLLESEAATAEISAKRVWWALGYSLFAYASLVLINLGHVGPDILVCAWVYLSIGILIRVSRDRAITLGKAVALGLVMALGYLTKTVMLPVALVVFATAVVILVRQPRQLVGLGVAAVVFGLVAGLWMGALSESKGRFTFGDIGKLNYAWKVDNVPGYRHWQGDVVHGTPLHATRPLSKDPVIYEFAEPVPGTYPVWYDASYWYDGVRVRLEPSLELRRLATSVEDYMSEGWFYPALVGVIILSLSAGGTQLRRALRSNWFVFTPVAAALTLYATLLVLGRYVGPFVVVGLLTLVTALGLGIMRDDPGNKIGDRTAGALSAVFFLMVVGQLWFNDRKTPRENVHLAVAARVAQLGVTPGSRVGVIGESSNAYWAHLAGDRIVAEILPEQSAWFWSQTADARTRQLQLFRLPKAVAVMADHVPQWADMTGWVPIGTNGYWLTRLTPSP